MAAPRTSVAAPTRDPRAEALDAIEALRSERLPEASRFGEHALRLGRILRVYLERSLGITQPGDTTPELVAHLRAGGAEPEELQRLAALLRIWDRVKFAREAPTVEEAQRAEQAVEAVVRRDRPIAAGRVA
ncbi:MAG: DUF4129 domain-containing protein [Candidatus Eisenbacteria bacterium]|uniref:DUF4129 domain-containing protein n=1 Tax=Eiseniibacteriota bacterium TaxID=2212470 RepID=A0A849SKN5_UNCEI|nr:DUF4129 domain-containing protein [Candidatus Eisenbacteria bacterium]